MKTSQKTDVFFTFLYAITICMKEHPTNLTNK